MENGPELTGHSKYEVIMAISTEDALKMVDAQLAAEASQAKEPAGAETTPAQTTGADGNKHDVVNAEPEPKAAGEPAGGEGKESVGKSAGQGAPDSKKQKRTHQARLDYSFKKLKDDLKAKEKRIGELEALLKKTKELTKEDFGGDEKEYQKHLVDNALRERDLEDLKRQKEDDEANVVGMEFVNDISAKADECFDGDDGARDHFGRLMENGFDKFAECVNVRDQNGVVWDFLSDSRFAPLIIRSMMTKPDILRRILDKKTDAGKLRELQVLENNISIRRNIRAVIVKNGAEKKELPKLGSMVKTTAKTEPEVYDDAWGAKYLREHRGGRFG